MTTVTLTLTEFLLARNAEDEAAARTAAAVGPDSERWRASPDWTNSSERWTVEAGSTRTLFACCEESPTLHDDGRGIGVAERSETEHIARHDPARVLAECDAKRRIVELCAEQVSVAEQQVDEQIDRSFNAGAAFAAHNTLLTLAAVYADHPDYRAEWATT
jgi:hypothetical protein